MTQLCAVIDDGVILLLARTGPIGAVNNRVSETRLRTEAGQIAWGASELRQNIAEADGL